MDECTVECSDGTRWRAIAASRPALHRIELVFESLDEPDTLLRAEAAAQSLSELNDDELCFLLGEARRAH
jgi:hypothetical protein